MTSTFLTLFDAHEKQEKTSIVSFDCKQTSYVDHLPCSYNRFILDVSAQVQRETQSEETIEGWKYQGKNIEAYSADYIGCPNINLFLSYIFTAMIYDHKTYRGKSLSINRQWKHVAFRIGQEFVGYSNVRHIVQPNSSRVMSHKLLNFASSKYPEQIRFLARKF